MDDKERKELEQGKGTRLVPFTYDPSKPPSTLEVIKNLSYEDFMFSNFSQLPCVRKSLVYAAGAGLSLAGLPMEGILDFQNKLDVELFDKVVMTAYAGGKPQEQRVALQLLGQFREHPDSWKRVDIILETSKFPTSKQLALSILENLVQTLWKALPPDQRLGIRKYIVAQIIKHSSEESSLIQHKQYLHKLNNVLVQILKQEWPQNWPNFIPEIIVASRSNLSLCENNMTILKLMSEEIFEFSAEQMTQQKQKSLKSEMCLQFSEVFSLCFEILQKATKQSLICETLETLENFLTWIPLGYIFETELIPLIVDRFLPVPAFRNRAIKCLTEIGSLQVSSEYDEKFIQMFTATLTTISQIVPVTIDLDAAYERGVDDDCQFIQNLSLFLTSFLGSHLSLLERGFDKSYVQMAHVYLVRISQVREREIFKGCLEYWAKLVAELYEEMQRIPISDLSFASKPETPRLNLYTEILSNLRVVMIERMVKPEEVLVVENDNGEIVRESMKESDTITLYKSMKEVLVYLTHLDVEDTEGIMNAKLAKQMDGSEWSWDNLNKLCFAIGSISGAMSEETEKRFLVQVIKDLLGLVEMKKVPTYSLFSSSLLNDFVKGKDNKAVVASDIMYIVGQYPRFLKAHWKFLKTVVNKLFEFMHELHEGVQDMACDTFIKISQKCKRHIITQQPQEIRPYIEDILDCIALHTSDLQPHQVHTFYEAVGHMISAQINKQQQERLVGRLMELPNQKWEEIIKRLHLNMGELQQPEIVKALGNILKTNVAAAGSIGPVYFAQIRTYFNDMMGLYKACSQAISAALATHGTTAVAHVITKGHRTIKREILKLLETFITKTDDLQSVAFNVVPPLLETILSDYYGSAPIARDYEVLNLLSTIISRLGNLVNDKVGVMMDGVFGCTLDMIKGDFQEVPEIRLHFFKFLYTINKNCFPALISFESARFKLYLDSMVWGFKHPMRDISDLALELCQELLMNFNKAEPTIANLFYQTYFLSLLQDVFYVLTSTLHKSGNQEQYLIEIFSDADFIVLVVGFKTQTLILKDMFQTVDTGAIRVPLFNPAVTAFTHLQPGQVHEFVLGLFKFYGDSNAFKIHVRDFLIQLKEFAGDESQKFFLDELEQEAAAKLQRDKEAALRIPGMVKPSERPDDGMMD
ncbi:Karyopherin transporter [Nowakowskiella sp. JEL0407]|nr:Karyopherin transporter [Nowakowskiella sp. JEL0407]